ncbi:hypothetical protein [Phytomonospora endophytica]|uniref:Uncharacterized protein n=1 Tax=Phytomonospora endophytica TaxID=714109 RepID=A0A841FS74_9ACTN|nr:hypothetical protein [Phytomonospora endophytica]MBB6038654.1 hypothetical protein [Phytomonospora endophytica]GIG69202.1 hypothetical protein Pen01_54970 [Phytomonospora endophytica]
MTETLGRFLSNVIEFVIAGVLFTTALVLPFNAFFPAEAARVWKQLTGGLAGAPSDALLFVVGSAFAYAAGTFAENMSRLAFEWRLNKVKRSRAVPISHGRMRTAIMARNPDLYLEVESQLKRMRIERVLCLCLLLLLPGLIASLARHATGARVCALVAASLALVLTLLQVEQRFRRYCRAIERGYEESSAVQPDAAKEPVVRKKRR